MTGDGHWSTRGACAKLPADVADSLFFHAPKQPGGARLDQHAKQLCARCTVRLECLVFALEHEISCGTWGGMTERERRRAYPRRRTA
jgi:WhiB family redox-sensing transcriptional regulator